MAHSVNWSITTPHLCAQVKNIVFFCNNPITFASFLSPLTVLLTPTVKMMLRRRRRQVSVRQPMDESITMT